MCLFVKEKVKINLSLCQNKYHAMKTYPLLNSTSHHALSIDFLKVYTFVIYLSLVYSNVSQNFIMFCSVLLSMHILIYILLVSGVFIVYVIPSFFFDLLLFLVSHPNLKALFNFISNFVPEVSNDASCMHNLIFSQSSLISLLGGTKIN
jgi:hypothetical protein